MKTGTNHRCVYVTKEGTSYYWHAKSSITGAIQEHNNFFFVKSATTHEYNHGREIKINEENR
jgi:hypothetical protein